VGWIKWSVGAARQSGGLKIACSVLDVQFGYSVTMFQLNVVVYCQTERNAGFFSSLQWFLVQHRRHRRT